VPPAYSDVNWVEVEAKGKERAIGDLRRHWSERIRAASHDVPPTPDDLRDAETLAAQAAATRALTKRKKDAAKAAEAKQDTKNEPARQKARRAKKAT
jgi:hypothetical protein